MKKLNKSEIIKKLFEMDEETVEFVNVYEDNTTEFLGSNNEDTTEFIEQFEDNTAENV